MKCNKTGFEYIKKLNKISADVWNYCVAIDKAYTDVNKKGINLSMLEFETKNKFMLHAKGIHHVVLKYISARDAMWRSRKANHDESRSVKLPYKEKKYFSTGWDSQAVHPEYDRNRIRLTSIKGTPQVICHVKNIPKNIVEIELVYKDKYYLIIKYKEENKNVLIESSNIASIDLGEIHAIASIDNNGNCIIITNRKIRSLIRLKDKRQGELQSLRSKCKSDSNRASKYTKAIYDIKYEYDRKIIDAIYKQVKLYTDWCIEHDISKVYYGDVDGTIRDTKGKMSKYINHKLNMWRFGLLVEKLQNKLSRHNIEMIKISEAYTTRTCPSCKKRNAKQKNRNYECSCGYKQHRDIVGAMNILNFNSDNNITRFTNKVYLRID